MERQLGVSLPSDYAAFLREHNGGHPELSVFWASPEKVETRNIRIEDNKLVIH